MGWKNVKDFYRIEHIVQIRDGKICIGSGYVSDLIRVTFDGQVSWGNLGPSSNDDLARYYKEMTDDLGKLRVLISMGDTFLVSLPVFTYEGAEIIEKQCESYGWPNVTHDGFVQYANAFHADKNVVVKWAKRNAELGVQFGNEHVVEAEKRLSECRVRLAREVSNLEKLNADYPESNTDSVSP